MGQIAYHAATGQMAEAFSVSDEEWDAIGSAQRGTWVMPRSGWPAVAKTSIGGLRFFAHNPGYTGILPKPESYAHTRLKIDVLKAARALGHKADLEVFGSAPEGDEWIADVLVTLPDASRMAFEVQLSSQHLKDFRARTERYARSGVRCCWVISNQPVDKRLSKALVYENRDYYNATREFQADAEDLLLLGVQLEGKDAYPDARPVLRFSRGREIRRMEMEEAIAGILAGQYRWERPSWHWTAPPLPTRTSVLGPGDGPEIAVNRG